MAIEVFNRYENKFLVNREIVASFENDLKQYMHLDAYNQSHPFYTISNIYYDTMDHHLIRTSLSKPKYKEKLRLRAYGVPKEDDKVFLEIKKKVCGLVNKRRTTLSLQEAYHFVETGEKPDLQPYMNKQVLAEIDYFLSRYELEPKLYLAYDRRAYFGINQPDLRLTLDTNIRSRRYDLKLEKGSYGESLLDESMWLMEIKAERSIPYWLTELLADYGLYKTSFSKYGKEYQRQLIRKKELKGVKIPCLKASLQPQQRLVAEYQS